MRKLMLATSAAAFATLTVPAFAATEAESRAQCTASGGTLDTSKSPWECKHPGPGPASSPTVRHTFEFEGATWTIIDGPPQAVSAVHMTSGSAKACPSLKIKLEPSDKGPKMTPEQKFRGDKRWHVVCVW